MKKLLVLLFASLLVLGACGQNMENAKDDKDIDLKPDKDNKKSDKKEKKSDIKEKENKESTKKSEPKSEEQSTEEVATNEQQTTQEVNSTEQTTQEQQTSEQPVQQPQYQEDSRGNIVEQPDENGQYTGNELPADFTTEGMSPEAQNKIDSLTRQKDFEGLPQEEYNRQVFEIMNNQ